MIPDGQQTELMGIFVFTSGVISWLPPLIFTVMVNMDIGMNWGLLILPVFYTLALITLILKVEPGYEEACDKAIELTAKFALENSERTIFPSEACRASEAVRAKTSTLEARCFRSYS